MNQHKISVLIPYKQRLDNLRLVFEGLTKQKMDKSDFEVVVGVMEYCSKYLELCREYNNKLKIVSVMSEDSFSIPKARNLAMKQASGEIALQMDADTLLSPYSLQRLYDENFSFGQKICIVGQVVGYDNNSGGDIKHIDIHPFIKYEEELDKLEKSQGSSKDPRFQVSHVIPWAFGWTGLIAIPLSLVKSYNLYFDETFSGWGVDDLEWSYRISKNHIPIALKENIRALHLPHTRDQSSNAKSEEKNYLTFIKKWSTIDVELAYVLGDIEANNAFVEYKYSIRNILTKSTNSLSLIKCLINDESSAFIGVEVDENMEIVDHKIRNLIDKGIKYEIKPIIGIAIPYKNCELERCYITARVLSMPTKYKDLIISEAARISKSYEILD
ncbi:MAG: glycosyltransferase family 2 protein [Rickettsiaceae bacterium]